MYISNLQSQECMYASHTVCHFCQQSCVWKIMFAVWHCWYFTSHSVQIQIICYLNDLYSVSITDTVSIFCCSTLLFISLLSYSFKMLFPSLLNLLLRQLMLFPRPLLFPYSVVSITVQPTVSTNVTYCFLFLVFPLHTPYTFH